MRLIDADALFAVVKGHHDLYNGATNPTDKARRDENLQVMCDITDAPDIDAIPMDFIRYRMDFAQENGFNEAYEAFAFVLRAWKTTGKLWEQEAR